MSKETYLHIKEPCHENWKAMTPVDQGRFCQSCAKQVIDFSRMSDTQILDVLSKATGNTCGRFTGSQLERPMVEEAIEISFFLKPYKIVLSSLVPLFVLSTNAFSQGQAFTLKGKVALQQQPVSPPIMMGDVNMAISDASIVHGRVLTDDGEAIAGATLRIKGSKTSIVSDASGSFSLRLNKGQQKAIMEVSYAGYEMKEIEVKTNVSAPLVIKLIPQEVVVMGYAIPSKIKIKHKQPIKPIEVPVSCTESNENMITAGLVSVVRTVSKQNTARTIVQKLLRNELFTVFPTPVNRAQNLHLYFKKEGDYSIQLFDNAGRLYYEKQLKSVAKNLDFMLALPAVAGSGVYYLKAINTSTKKQFIEKIVVQ